MSKNLVIVESPAKAKTISKYLGKDFEVMASYGHVRDLIPKEGAVDPDSGFAMKYQVIERNEKHVKAIVRALKKAEALYLATDPDREGEAISWHLIELLKEKGALDGKLVHRVVFHEITKHAVQEAIDHPRGISGDLVGAQQARFDVIALYKDGAGYPAWNLPGFVAFLVPVALTIIAIILGNTSWFYGFYTYGWFTGSILGGLIYYFVAGRPAGSEQ